MKNPFQKNILRTVFPFRLFTALFLIAICFVQTADASFSKNRTLELPLQKIKPGLGEILIDFTLPANHHFAREAPSTVQVRTKNSSVLKVDTRIRPILMEQTTLPYSIPCGANPGMTIVAIDMHIHFCNEVTKVCLSDSIRVKFPVEVTAVASEKINLSVPLKSKILK